MYYSFVLILFAVTITLALPFDQRWNEFKADHGKIYTKSEDAMRKDIFIKNLAKIDANNVLFLKGNVTYELGMNKFADWVINNLTNRFN